MKQQFEHDLETLYNYINEQKTHINQLYAYLENNQLNKLNIIDTFAQTLKIEELNNEVRLALITRLVSLRDDSLVQVLKKMDKNDQEIVDLQEIAYDFVKHYWHDVHKNTIEFIKKNQLLTPFYQAIFEGVYEVGLAMSAWQTSWTALIINGVNKELLNMHNNDEEKVFEFLTQNSLFDLGHHGEIADRCYSVLIQKNGKFESQAYIKAFKKEVTLVVDKLELFVDTLIDLEDNVYNQKWQYILYIQSLVKAFSQDKTDTLISSWAEVDEAWMAITTPIQIGHPLEYYEDHFRKAVALEWDIRLSSPKANNNNQRASKLENMFDTTYTTMQRTKEYDKIIDFSKHSLTKVQLYLGRPALFFAAEFNGLFSAQVVPNDEIVSMKHGKKIFAFSDEILQAQRAKPFLRLSREILGQEFLTQEREFLFKEDEKWHQVYDITTIGHEFGHILWCDDQTESIMNNSGNFKNIEEFKATTGGLVSFYMDNDPKESTLWQA
ncbi:MAG: invasion protein CiaB, partial [Campylobacterota bacterium]|nr:invasion protein CiaB [Campylobacterota bacterium]